MYHVQYKWKAKTSWYKSEIRVAVIESAHEFAKTFPTVFLILISYCRITITVRLNKIDQINQLFINLDITMVPIDHVFCPTILVSNGAPYHSY